MTGARVLVTGVGDGLGRSVAEQIATRDDVEVVIGVTGGDTLTIAGVQVIGLPGEYDGIADLLQGRRSTRSFTPSGHGPGPVETATRLRST